MSSDTLAQRIIAAHQRMDTLLRRIDQAQEKPQEFFNEALADLRAAEEDLRGAEMVLGLKDKELAAARDALKIEHQRYRELFEFTADGYIRTDSKGFIQEVNRAALTLLQVEADGGLGHSLLAFFISKDRRMVSEKLTQLRAGDTLKEVEVCLHPRGGAMRWVVLTIEGIYDRPEQLVGLRWLMRDITSRKELELELERTNSLVASLSHTAARMESARDPDWVMQTLGVELAVLKLTCLVVLLESETQSLLIHYFWATASTHARMEALTEEKLIGMPIPRERFNCFAEVIEQGRPIFTQNGGPLFAAALPFVAQTVREHACRLAGFTSDTCALHLPLRIEEQVIGAMGIWGDDLRESDIPTFAVFGGEIAGTLERARLLMELERQRAQLQALSARLVTVLEDERRRIARELHDEAGQLLYGLRLQLDVLARRLPSQEPQLHTQLAGLYELLEAARMRIHKLSQELRPPTLDELGLEPVLQRLVNNFTSETGLDASFTSMGLDERLAPDLETACYRIVQEALTNVIRHAKARHVSVSLMTEDGYVSLKITDDGRGFDARRGRTEGLGLLGIRERAIGLGGEAVIHSVPGDGTYLEVKLPRLLLEE